ncbi:MAG: hypothetical protein II125_02435, partial [Ruminococcus sp.]|nr:hypothetical protein [Ruminococcus sp.]
MSKKAKICIIQLFILTNGKKHIPILMLTANAMDEHRIEGLTEGGADAYMSKPFNADVLRAQLRSLVNNHNRVRDFFGSSSIGIPSNPS